jgi:hypothetical protein
MSLLNRCAHIHTVGIYGDRIYTMPGQRRILCVNCGRALDGPVSWAGDHSQKEKR